MMNDCYVQITSPLLAASNNSTTASTISESRIAPVAFNCLKPCEMHGINPHRSFLLSNNSSLAIDAISWKILRSESLLATIIGLRDCMCLKLGGC